jgi:hypothetical protein
MQSELLRKAIARRREISALIRAMKAFPSRPWTALRAEIVCFPTCVY